jgi:hypothetical protein
MLQHGREPSKSDEICINPSDFCILYLFLGTQTTIEACQKPLGSVLKCRVWW